MDYFDTNSRSVFDVFLDKLFPPICPGCGALGYGFCNVCSENILPQHFSYKDYTDIYAAGRYEGALKSAILCVKQLGYTYLIHAIVRKMLEALPTYLKETFKVVCVPVPADSRRFNERGFHTPNLLAKELCRQLDNFIYSPQCLVLTRSLSQQKELSRPERFANVKGAYKGLDVKDKFVVVVDDVVTTGATVYDTVRALYEIGAIKVEIVCAGTLHEPTEG